MKTLNTGMTSPPFAPAVTVWAMFFVLLTAYSVHGQDHHKKWSEGRLTWDDFQTSEPKDDQISELAYFIGYDQSKTKRGDSVFIMFATYAYVDRNLSWVAAGFKTKDYLLYNQICFDLVEVYRRRLQHGLDRVGTLLEAELLLARIQGDLAQELHYFGQATDGGRIGRVVAQRNKAVEEQLRDLDSNYLASPPWHKRDFGGLHAGLGVGAFTGELARQFVPAFDIVFGFDLAYKSSLLFLNGTLAFTQAKNTYPTRDFWSDEQKVHLAIVEVSYGYAVLDGAKWKLAPFAGLGITEFSEAVSDPELNGWRIVDYNVLFGLNADWKISKRVNLVPDYMFGIREYSETSLRARVYLTRADFFDNLGGFTIHLTVGVSGFGRLLRISRG